MVFALTMTVRGTLSKMIPWIQNGRLPVVTKHGRNTISMATRLHPSIAISGSGKPNSTLTKEQRRDSQEDNGETEAGIFRVGGDVSPPKVLTRVQPEYTEVARLAKLQGTLIISSVVNKAGELEIQQIIEPLGLGLDDSAVESMRRWKFEPARRNGEPVNVLLKIEINFSLE